MNDRIKEAREHFDKSYASRGAESHVHLQDAVICIITHLDETASPPAANAGQGRGEGEATERDDSIRLSYERMRAAVNHDDPPWEELTAERREIILKAGRLAAEIMAKGARGGSGSAIDIVEISNLARAFTAWEAGELSDPGMAESVAVFLSSARARRTLAETAVIDAARSTKKALCEKGLFRLKGLNEETHEELGNLVDKVAALDGLSPPPGQGEAGGPSDIPRPLAIRHGVADLMVDELAKQYQKAGIYGSLANRWRNEAQRLGSKVDRFEVDPLAAQACTNEAALAFARETLRHAWLRQGDTEEDEPASPLPPNIPAEAGTTAGLRCYACEGYGKLTGYGGNSRDCWACNGSGKATGQPAEVPKEPAAATEGDEAFRRAQGHNTYVHKAYQGGGFNDRSDADRATVRLMNEARDLGYQQQLADFVKRGYLVMTPGEVRAQIEQAQSRAATAEARVTELEDALIIAQNSQENRRKRIEAWEPLVRACFVDHPTLHLGEIRDARDALSRGGLMGTHANGYFYTGVKLTHDEEAAIRGNIYPRLHLRPHTSQQERIHAAALAHGLPEIEGFYGYDFEEHEFVRMPTPEESAAEGGRR